ncbi:MAG: sulfite exporter TauE/SafE family protein [Ruminococcaceae bacterium]|nr:sulfite exporter TauE/SafE family protein [Oscillospiraceae bacterium]
MIWIDIIFTFLFAALAGMGIGSGGLLVLYLTLFRNTPQLSAQGFNLLFFLFASAASMIVHLKRRHIHLLAVILILIAGLPAAYLGTRTALFLPEGLGSKLFGLFLIAVGLPRLLSLNKEKTRQKS